MLACLVKLFFSEVRRGGLESLLILAEWVPRQLLKGRRVGSRPATIIDGKIAAVDLSQSLTFGINAAKVSTPSGQVNA